MLEDSIESSGKAVNLNSLGRLDHVLPTDEHITRFDVIRFPKQLVTVRLIDAGNS